MKVSALGMPWYEREDYPRILEIMADADKLPDTHADFVKRAELGERQLKSQGHIVVRAVIKPDEFAGWCAVRGLKLDAQARMRFGSEAAAKAVKNVQ